MEIWNEMARLLVLASPQARPPAPLHQSIAGRLHAMRAFEAQTESEGGCMRPTHAINTTARRDWKYVRAHKTDVAATMRAWLRSYEADWDAAHAEQAERERQPANVKPMRKSK